MLDVATLHAQDEVVITTIGQAPWQGLQQRFACAAGQGLQQKSTCEAGLTTEVFLRDRAYD